LSGVWLSHQQDDTDTRKAQELIGFSSKNQHKDHLATKYARCTSISKYRNIPLSQPQKIQKARTVGRFAKKRASEVGSR
jgi:hypothetical protein